MRNDSDLEWTGNARNGKQKLAGCWVWSKVKFIRSADRLDMRVKGEHISKISG